jgi:DEAD/DEAH box helicase domain-containing protein
VLVATNDPLNQYIVRHPQFFFGASPEHARVHPDQLLILLDHVRCAAFELPFNDGDTFGGEDLAEMLAYLQQQGILQHQAERWYWIADGYPANAVSLRAVAQGNFVVVDITDGGHKVRAEVDYASTPGTLYQGAIYMIQSQPFQVERLDWVGRKAFVRRTQADYYTDAIDYTRLKILSRFETRRTRHGGVAHGEVHLVRRYPGYKKIRYYSHDNVGYGNIDLPDQEMHSTALWWQVASRALEAQLPQRDQAMEGFLGAAYALHHVATVRAMAEIRDLGRAVGDGEGTWAAVLEADGQGRIRRSDGVAAGACTPDRFAPTLFLYDSYPGGIGLSAPLFEAAAALVADARSLARACSCKAGCPACVGPILTVDQDRNTSPKALALRVLDLLDEA